MKKRRVAASLHSELSEYTSLLRALRTNDALDVTKHLTNAPSFARLDDLAGIDIPSSPLPGPSDLSHPNNHDFADESDNGSSRKGKSRESSMPAKSRRDHWTRWPLLINDVLPPKWTLDDEIAVIAAQVLKMRPPLQFPVPCEDEECEGEQEDIQARDMELDEEDPDLPFFVPYLTTTIADYLATVLSLLSAHTPARPASMQNRIEPLDWRAVIDVVVCSGIKEYSNPKIVENVIKRMEAIYERGPSSNQYDDRPTRAVERMKRKADVDESFDYKIGREIEQLFAVPILRPVDETTKEGKETREDTGYRPRIRGFKRQRLTQESEGPAPQADSSELAPRRSGRQKPAVNYYIPPPPDKG
ncbi:hypothetical protein CVT24_007826 [Panaeolus cyanescens]|uniref:Uncharacterized protein n=1 Tax=Panaeolus cyanescens TaxID=181874 RepID=A0A409VZL6_9AGAR|nr:hypothetical protein CVT24_007826 [Panaeolus cyanescens]